MDAQANTSTAVVLYNPSQFQNRTMKPLPVGWTTRSVTPTSFTCFAKVPAELRCEIYSMALSQKRILTIQARIDGDYEYCRGMPGFSFNVQCDTPNPALLYVCVESKTEALKKLQVLELKRSLGQYKTKIPIYFNVECDTFAFRESDHLLRQMSLERFAGVRSIGLWCLENFSAYSLRLIGEYMRARAVDSEATIEELIIIIPSPYSLRWGRAMGFLVDAEAMDYVGWCRMCCGLNRLPAPRVQLEKDLGTDIFQY